MVILLAFAFVIALTSNPPGYSIPPATISVAGGLAFPMIHKFSLTIKPQQSVKLPIDYGLLIAYSSNTNNFALVASVNYITKNSLVEHKLTAEKTEEFFTIIKYSDTRFEYDAILDCIFIGTYCKVEGA